MKSDLKPTYRKHLDVLVAILLITAGAWGFHALKNPKLMNALTADSFDHESDASRAFSVWVGSLKKQKGNIRFRFGDSAVWHEMDNESERVNFGDSLFTAKDGQALLHLKSGEQVEVMPNTLVVMKKEIAATNTNATSDHRAPIELKHGRVRITLKKGDLRPVSVDVQGKRYEIMPAQASPMQNQDLVKDENTVDVVAVEGKDGAPELESAIPLQIHVAEVTPEPKIEITTAPSPVEKSLETTTPEKVLVETPVAPAKEPAKEINLTLAPGESFSHKVKKIEKQEEVASKPRVASEAVLISERKPAAESTPAPTPEKIIAKEPATPEVLAKQTTTPSDGSGTGIEVTPFLGMSTLSSTDLTSGTKDSLASSVNLGLDAKYFQIWNESFKTYLRGKLSYISFAQPVNSLQTLQSSSKLLTTFGLGASQALSSRLTITGSFDLEQNLFIRAASSTSVTTDSVLTPSIGAKVSYDLIKLNAFILGVSADYEEKMKASTDAYSIGLGHSYGGTIEVRQRKRGEDMFAVDLGGSERSQNTSLTDQTETIYSLSVRFFFPVTKPGKDEENDK